MNELEAMKKKKQELVEKNNRLKESQSKPVRDYSNSVTRSNGPTAIIQNSAGSSASRKSTQMFNVTKITDSQRKSVRSPVREEIKELQAEENTGEREAEEDRNAEIQNALNEPSKIDLAYEAAIAAPQGVNNIVQKKYLVFRPYIDPMNIKPHKPADKGYYFKFYNGVNVPLIRYTLEDNGFREATERN